MSDVLYHISDQPGTEVFEPRPAPPTSSQRGEVVWAVDEAHLHNYLLPRDCPRVTFYALPTSDPADVTRLLAGVSAGAVVAIEAAWVPALLSQTLYRYDLPAETFRCIDPGAGYYVSEVPVRPLRVTPITDVLAVLLEREVELRVMPSLWALNDAVVNSTLQFSMIRMRNAQPRPSQPDSAPSGPLQIAPVTLEGRHVRLEPLTLRHLDALEEVALDEDLWRWTTANIQTKQDLRTYVAEALRQQAVGTALPFTIIDKASGRAAGSTRYGSISRADRRVEIGWTWVAREWQRTAINTEAKYLLLRHAFETLGCVRVELKTDALNERSRRAIARIGATEEGVLRRHMVSQGGRLRDTVYFSIIAEEWPAVRARLEAKLGL